MVYAHTGDVVFYAMDQDDPSPQIYQRAFPNLFTNFSQMPSNLKRHFAIPLDCFRPNRTSTYLPQVGAAMFLNQSKQ